MAIKSCSSNCRLYFEPSKEEIVLTLIPKSLKQLYKGIRDSFASEHGARYDFNAQSNGQRNRLRNQLINL
jgi:F-type H+-transporting ATPase subunit gamma